MDFDFPLQSMEKITGVISKEKKKELKEMPRRDTE